MAQHTSRKGRVDAKIVIIGSSGAGKTALVTRFVHSKFAEFTDLTLGGTYLAKTVRRGQESIHLSLWDTAGVERYSAMTKQYYRNANGAILCYDITDRSSWDRMRSWANEILDNEPGCRLFVCGTKKDLVDDGKALMDVSLDNVKFYAEGLRAPSIVTSSKTGENVDALFATVADQLWDEVRNKPLAKNVVSLDRPKAKTFIPLLCVPRSVLWINFLSGRSKETFAEHWKSAERNGRLTLAQLGFRQEGQVKMESSLTSNKLKLFQKALEHAKKFQYRRVGVLNGEVYLLRDSRSGPLVYVKSTRQLEEMAKSQIEKMPDVKH